MGDTKHTAIDVLEKAHQLVCAGEVETNPECGDFCARCAISKAQTKIELQNDTGVSEAEAMSQVLSGNIIELPSDQPLVDAREALVAVAGTKEEVLRELSDAINYLKEEDRDG